MYVILIYPSWIRGLRLIITRAHLSHLNLWPLYSAVIRPSQVLEFKVMQATHWYRRALLQFALAIGVSLLSGCTEPPKGHDMGRVPVDTTTQGERGDFTLRSADLFAACDEIAQALAVDIRRIVDEEFTGHRITLVVGDITNKTGIVPRATLEIIQTRIVDALSESGVFRDHVKVVECRARMERLNKEGIGAGPEDILQTGSYQVTPDLNPEYTVYLLGDAYGAHAGSTHTYYISFKLNRAADRAQVFAKAYEVKYDVETH